MRARLSKVAVCDQVGLCDENLSFQLFCSDAIELNEVLNANLIGIQFEIHAGFFYAARVDEFMKSCGAKDGGVVFKLPQREPLLLLPER
jgi:hypothetical protein